MLSLLEVETLEMTALAPLCGMVLSPSRTLNSFLSLPRRVVEIILGLSGLGMSLSSLSLYIFSDSSSASSVLIMATRRLLHTLETVS